MTKHFFGIKSKRFCKFQTMESNVTGTKIATAIPLVWYEAIAIRPSAIRRPRAPLPRGRWCRSSTHQRCSPWGRRSRGAPLSLCSLAFGAWLWPLMTRAWPQRVPALSPAVPFLVLQQQETYYNIIISYKTNLSTCNLIN